MAFGAPRPSVILVSIAMVFIGLLVGITAHGWVRWLGGLLFALGFLSGLVMGSWSQLLPTKPPKGPDWMSDE